MKIEYFIACRSSAVDNASNQLSLFEVIESISIDAPPRELISIPIFMVGTILRETEQEELNFSLQIDILIPGEEEWKKVQLHKVKMEKSHQRLRIRFPIQIPFGPSGRYAVRAKLDDESNGIAVYHIDISGRTN